MNCASGDTWSLRSGAIRYEEGAGVEKSAELARQWYTRAARQGHELALERCRALGIAVWEAAEP